MYRAIEIAKLIVSMCTDENAPISNLKLQKILYFLWVDYYKECGRPLFYDSICAWQLGPVVPEVYYEFCSYAGRPISLHYDVAIDDETRQRVYNTVQKYMYTPASALVGRTHSQGTPWSKVYKDGAGLRDTIPFDLIVDIDCQP